MSNTDPITEFPQSVVEEIGYYVYSLTDPLSGKIFYIGKGTGNRIFAHVHEAIGNPEKSDKLDMIRQIRKAGQTVKYEILRHGMTEKESLEVEAALIDFVGLSDLTNKVSGWRMDERGRMTISEVIATYRAEEVKIKEPALLIIVNRLYQQNMEPERLYDVTRGDWVLGSRRNKAKFAFSVYRGLVREVYEISDWIEVEARDKNQNKKKNRWCFTGAIAKELQHYVGGSVRNYIKRGNQSPVLYLNC
jgi:hypothetical protein